MAVEPEVPPTSALLPPGEVNYRRADSDQMCQGCSFFQPPSACSMVEGVIDPTWVCDLWQTRRGASAPDADVMGQLFG